MSHSLVAGTRGVLLFGGLAVSLVIGAGCGSTPTKMFPKHDLGVPHDLAVSRDGPRNHPPDLSTTVGGGDMARVNCGGAPPCQVGQGCCANTCIDTTTDPANCGACSAACDTGETCAAGACGCGMAGTHCAAPMVCCGGACLDPSADNNNCGACNVVCMNGDTCSGGACAPAGGCNPPCPAGQTCSNGQCMVPMGQCNPPCAVGQTCLLGAICIPTPCNPPCPMNQICDKAVCVPSCGIGIKTPCAPPKTCLGGNICI